MGYNNYNSGSSAEQSPTFNAELFHRQMTLEMLKFYIDKKQEKDYDAMFEIMESIVDNNSPLIDTKDIDIMLVWLRQNKSKWCIKDPETNQIVRINTKNREDLEIKFQETHRAVVNQLFEHGIIHKIKDDPAHAMKNFD